MPLTVAAVQYRPPKGDPDRARRELVERVGQALQQGARLVVCPEMATSGYVWRDADEIAPFAEPADGPTRAALAPLAQAHGAWVVCGFPERSPEGALYNSALVMGPEGRFANYRKVLLFDEDKSWAQAGERRLLVQTEHGVMAPGICMDINDDGFTAMLREHQPPLCAFCTSWVDEGLDILPYWRWRLLGWQGVFVAADCWGEDRGVRFYGRSAILGPGGQVLAMAPATGDAVLVAQI